jgi:hypothetical protein
LKKNVEQGWQTNEYLRKVSPRWQRVVFSNRIETFCRQIVDTCVEVFTEFSSSIDGVLLEAFSSDDDDELLQKFLVYMDEALQGVQFLKEECSNNFQFSITSVPAGFKYKNLKRILDRAASSHDVIANLCDKLETLLEV